MTQGYEEREMAGRLDGKVAIITGTGNGQARAAAILFAREGARVVGCDVDVEAAARTLETVTAAGDEMVSMQPCDLTERSAAEQLVALALDSYGGIDIVYNSAAYAFFAPFADLTYEEWSGTLKGELDIIFHLTQLAWPHLVERGGGSIINTASIAGLRGFVPTPEVPHATGKSGVHGMTRQLATEGGAHGIRANSISPGLIRSKMLEPLIADAAWVETVLKGQLIDRIGEPDDIAYCALYLASDESSLVTGSDFVVDAGTSCRMS
jgi:meso-butanediol dehydrogenase / (S,S)-butanediol dehydrogenase / diacetyl reductase